MSARRSRTKRIVWGSIIGVLAVVLILFAFIVVPILTHESAGSSGQIRSAEYVSQVSAEGEDGRTRTLEVTDEHGGQLEPDNLHAGDLVTVTGTGYDSSIGIYVSFCQLPSDTSKKPGPCLGDIPASEDSAEEAADDLLSSAWVSNNWAWKAFATHQFTGDGFSVNLVVPEPAGNGADCLEKPCGIVTRADHTAASDRVQDVALPIAWDGQRPDEGSEDSAGSTD